MKSLLEEDPSELMGLDEENDPMEVGGSEDEEDEPTELMGLGEEEDEEEEPFDLDSEEEEEPVELLGLDEEDDEEEEGEEGPQSIRQRIPGLRLAQGLRAKRRARAIAVAALRARRRARLLALAVSRRRRRARLLALLRTGHDGARGWWRSPPSVHARRLACSQLQPSAHGAESVYSSGQPSEQGFARRRNRLTSKQNIAPDSELCVSVWLRVLALRV